MPGDFYTVTLADVATWPVPNYTNPVRRGWLGAFATAWLSVSTVLVFGRLYLRFRKKAGNLGLDDLLIFIAWVFAVVFTAVAWLEGSKYGLDRHIWDLEPSNYVPAAFWAWLTQLIFIVSTMSTKMSVLLFYRRMVKESYSRVWLYVFWIAIVFTICSYMSVFFTYLAICQPLDAYWLAYKFSAYTVKYHCINGNALTINSALITVISDFYVVLLPCLTLRQYRLELPRRQLIALNALFSLGFLVTGAGIARAYYQWRLGHYEDLTWTGFTLYCWAIVECQLSIICACAPACRVFFRRYLAAPFRRTTTGASHQRIEEDANNATFMLDTKNSALHSPTSDYELAQDQFGRITVVESPVHSEAKSEAGFPDGYQSRTGTPLYPSHPNNIGHAV